MPAMTVACFSTALRSFAIASLEVMRSGAALESLAHIAMWDTISSSFVSTPVAMVRCIPSSSAMPLTLVAVVALLE